MSSDISLPGLNHLISRLIFHEEALELRPPVLPPPEAGDDIAGMPLDPLLARMYKRCDGGRFGDLYVALHSNLASRNDKSKWNVDEDERPKRLFSYATISGLAFDFATVPSLANSEGVQPVVFYIRYEDQPILPMASDIDRAFRLYAIYCDKCHAAGGTLWDSPVHINFPDSVVKEIAQDRPLVELLEAGRFDNLIRQDLHYPDEDWNWIRKILREAKAAR